MQAATPFVTVAQWRADNDAKERALMRLRLQNQRDALEIKAMDTPAGIERAARRLGYVMPNERPLRIPEK